MSPLERLGVALPIVQAPMAGVSTPALAAAVSNARALGSLAVGAANIDTARAMIAETRARTARPFGVNVFTHAEPVPDPAREAAWCAWLAPHFAAAGTAPPAALRPIYPSFNRDPAALALLLETRPALVSFHFGLPPAGAVRALRAAGITLAATVTSTTEAQQAAGAGIDLLVAQGIEAGGHRGMFDREAPDDQLGTMALVRLLVRGQPLPVIAAGGIMDGAGIAAALALGAVAAQLGTAFVACPESAANDGYRAALVGPGAAHTRLTSAISGRPARVIANRFAALGEAPGAPPPPAYPIAYDAGKALHAAASAAGEHGYGAHWAGQGAPLARATPAARLVATLADELAAVRVSP